MYIEILIDELNFCAIFWHIVHWPRCLHCFIVSFRDFKNKIKTNQMGIIVNRTISIQSFWLTQYHITLLLFVFTNFIRQYVILGHTIYIWSLLGCGNKTVLHYIVTYLPSTEGNYNKSRFNEVIYTKQECIVVIILYARFNFNLLIKLSELVFKTTVAFEICIWNIYVKLHITIG